MGLNIGGTKPVNSIELYLRLDHKVLYVGHTREQGNT